MMRGHFVGCTQPPVLRLAKPGVTGSVCNIFDRSENSEPVPHRERVRGFPVWWTVSDSIALWSIRRYTKPASIGWKRYPSMVAGVVSYWYSKKTFIRKNWSFLYEDHNENGNAARRCLLDKMKSFYLERVSKQEALNILMLKSWKSSDNSQSRELSELLLYLHISVPDICVPGKSEKACIEYDYFISGAKPRTAAVNL